jgi:nucleotide-binding universal stress UspA family protein
MNAANQILLASHGTEGAMAAEEMAIKVCHKGARIHHLIVVPSLWEGMTGDDWLNNGSTRNTFRRYLESELGREVDEHIQRVRGLAEEHELEYTNEMVVGEPDDCLLKAAQKEPFDLVIMGSPRPKGKTGLRSRMATNVTRGLPIPVLMVPYPNE